ncbi:MAG: tetratricopeptide repeat protein [Acidobacteriia bacterium]|nr:tetratricopeptide repeat protein [Terriglobia bacterium]
MSAFLSRFMFVIALAAVVHGQGANTNVVAMDQANQLYSAKNWSAAAPAFETITHAEPGNALAWLRLGVSRHKLGQYASAVEAYKHIESDPQVGSSALYREAASLAKLNRNQEAIASLDKAIDAGLAQPSMFQQDADLASLRDEPGFRAVIEKADAIAHPCVHHPEYREFDFWIGEWDVVTTQGHNPAGTSSIQPIIDQCVLLENWTGGGGGTGKSFNHYDTSRKIWMQDWVDSRSNSIHFEGKLEDGVMSYYAESRKPDGTPIRRHLQFFKLDSDHVRQFSQQSSDGGKSWTTEYDFTYNRKK